MLSEKPPKIVCCLQQWGTVIKNKKYAQTKIEMNLLIFFLNIK